MHTFKAVIAMIGINPFVFVPDKVLQKIFKQAGKKKRAYSYQRHHQRQAVQTDTGKV